jgi:hypothetical protein
MQLAIYHWSGKPLLAGVPPLRETFTLVNDAIPLALGDVLDFPFYFIGVGEASLSSKSERVHAKKSDSGPKELRTSAP